MNNKVGITTTIPVEVLYAAGVTPVDLNNRFITSENPRRFVEQAELDGYPRNVCGWIRGIYGAVLAEGYQRIIAVTQGDCSNTHAMMETFKGHGIEIIPFAYPYERDVEMLSLQIRRLMDAFGVSESDVLRAKTRLDAIRQKAHRIDELTWREGEVSGWENHYYQICCSDFNSDPDAFESEVDQFLIEAEKRPANRQSDEIRIGILGVPTIFGDLYQVLDRLGVRVVFNEIQRQFSMPFETEDLVEQYRLYTYPYDIFGRIEDIRREVERREIDALIHYTQSFCFRQIQDLILRKEINLPILSLEGDNPGRIDARTQVRIESFLEMLM